MPHVSNNISWTTLQNSEEVASNSISSTRSRTSRRVPTPCRNDEAISRALQYEESLTLKDEVKDDSFIVEVIYEDEKKARVQEIEDAVTESIMSMEYFPYGARLAALSWLYDCKAE